jgi:Protein of unknown function (DUF3000)
VRAVIVTATYPSRVALPVEPVDPFAGLRDGVFGAIPDAQRPGLVITEVPAPRKLAPHALALSAEVTRDGEEVASGRFVVLHDPAGQEGWRGDTRVVAFVSADVDAEMAADPALAGVGWQWLEEALVERGAAHTAAGGTVTRTSSRRFGQLEEPDETNEVEVRASWTAVAGPSGAVELGRHLRAWCDLLSSTAGLPPVGVTALRR